MPMLLPSVEPTAQAVNPVAAPESKNFAPEAALAQGKAAENISVLASQVHDNLAEAGAKQNDNELFGALQDMEFKYKQLTNKDAVDAMPEVLKSAKEKIQQIQNGITDPLQQGMFTKIANARMQTFSSGVQTYALGNLKAWNTMEDKGRIELARTAAYNQWSFWKDPNSKQFSDALSGYNARVEEAARNQGIPPGSDTYKQFRMEEMTKLHESVIGTMISNGMSKDAKEYYQTYLNDIDVDKRKGLAEHLKIATTATDADNMAEDIFAGWAKGKDINAGVPLYELEAEARKRAGDNEDVQRAAIAGIKERAASWNGQQTEMKAQNIAAAWKMYDSGASVKQIKLSPEWGQLTGKEQHDILAGIESDRATKAARAAANSQREIAEIEKRERLAFLKNGDSYLTLTDPNVLKMKSRAQIEASRGQFGMAPTQHLLSMWDSIQNPGKFKEAQWESDSFKAAVRSLGMNPDSKNKSERESIGALKYHVEQLLNHVMTTTKTPMTPEQKDAFIRKELSNKVLINPGPFSFNNNVPIVSLTNKQISQVVIPPSERKLIGDAMSQMYKKTGSQEFAPTDYNLKVWYLRKKTPGFSSFNGEQ